MKLDLTNLVHDAIAAMILFIYVIMVVFGTKILYHMMILRGIKHNVAIYFNRKIIHLAAGGIVAVLLPYIFHEPFIPFILSLILALVTYIPHRIGKLMYWFQIEDNMYEVNFCIAWGVSVLVLWLILGDPKMAILPAILISFGDAVTGIVRNILFGRRTKHWIGNIAMASVTIPLGIIYVGIVGGIISIISAIVERFEFKPIDDNILIGLISTAMLILARSLSFI